MDYITDRPIDTAENDLLGRSLFSKHLGETIYSALASGKSLAR